MEARIVGPLAQPPAERATRTAKLLGALAAEQADPEIVRSIDRGAASVKWTRPP
jgi:hypothetical protein